MKTTKHFNGGETQLQHIKEHFTNSIKNSKNGLNYFIKFLDFYAKSRPLHQNVSKELVECSYSCFPEQINDTPNVTLNAV